VIPVDCLGGAPKTDAEIRAEGLRDDARGYAENLQAALREIARLNARIAELELPGCCRGEYPCGVPGCGPSRRSS
jgi:hypothetical protein